MRDSYGRHIDYLRISLTDRCNFRCLYCMPEEGVESLTHYDILTFEELLRIARISADLGVSKVRLTGGEPLVRKGVPNFIKSLKAIEGIEKISMTTNGFLLKQMAEELRDAGLDRINISLDTVDREKFHHLTRRDGLVQVLEGIDHSIKLGFDPIKINAVIMKDQNDREILSLVRYAEEKNLILRFIEHMPFNKEDAKSFISASEIQELLSRELGRMVKVENPLKNGPEQLYRFGEKGPTIGFITPVTNHFCNGCNRLRITADGKLKPCLLSSQEIDIRGALRQGAEDEQLMAIFKQAIDKKPEKHRLDNFGVESMRGMSKIGG